LEQVNITHEPGGDGFASLKDFEAAVRDALQGGVPPASLRVDTGDACEYLRAAFRVWATELRPKWVGVGASAGVPPTEEGVLLAELGVPVVRDTGGAWVVAARSSREVEVREERRPYLLHLRMVQEWIECGRRVRSPSDSVVAEISFGQTPSPGTDEAYSRADHTHGTPALEGDVVDRLGRTVLERIQDVPVEYDSETATDGQLLTYSVVTEEDLKREIEKGEERDEVRRRFEAGARWRPADLRLQGARVAREQDAGRPTAGQVLTYVTVGDAREGVWQASDVVGSSGTTSLSGDATGPTDQTVVQAIQGTPIIDFAEEKFAPQPGQVLTFVGPRGDEERDVAGQWVAADPQAQASTVTLGGDVTGQSDRTRVSQIQGAAIVPRSGTTPFANGDVLTFRNGNWVPLPPPTSQPPAVPNLEGDVVGPVGSNSLRGIKGFPVLSRQTGIGVATYEEGDVLVFRDGQWVPEAKSGAGRSGEFVERPAGLPPYSIVAAGIVSHNGGRFPVYNNLNLRVVGNGLVTVGFDGYKVPDDTFQYIVKALPVFNPELRLLDLVVEFDSFLSTDNLGFRLRVTSGGQPVDGERLQFVELMIEVSRYEMTPKE
ncbi:MAG TPA: hypothetical protein VFX96_06590, partial [Pyrinomonadaceae bacterium]|nr:hypothetical protein [Pyrinomonadaceae bacterium]